MADAAISHTGGAPPLAPLPFAQPGPLAAPLHHHGDPSEDVVAIHSIILEPASAGLQNACSLEFRIFVKAGHFPKELVLIPNDHWPGQGEFTFELPSSKSPDYSPQPMHPAPTLAVKCADGKPWSPAPSLIKELPSSNIRLIWRRCDEEDGSVPQDGPAVPSVQPCSRKMALMHFARSKPASGLNKDHATAVAADEEQEEEGEEEEEEGEEAGTSMSALPPTEPPPTMIPMPTSAGFWHLIAELEDPKVKESMSSSSGSSHFIVSRVYVKAGPAEEISIKSMTANDWGSVLVSFFGQLPAHTPCIVLINCPLSMHLSHSPSELWCICLLRSTQVS